MIDFLKCLIGRHDWWWDGCDPWGKRFYRCRRCENLRVW